MSDLFDYMCMRLPFLLWSIAGEPLSQALPGFLITAHPPVLVPAVLSALALWIQNKKIKIKSPNRDFSRKNSRGPREGTC